MDRRSTAARISIFSALAAYLLLGTVSTGPGPTIGVLLVVLVLWFSVYRVRYKGVGNRELATKMRGDLRGMLEGIEEGLARHEAQRRAAAEHEERVRVERERRRATRPAMDPAMSRYAAMIENRVRESSGGDQGPKDHSTILPGAKGQQD